MNQDFKGLNTMYNLTQRWRKLTCCALLAGVSLIAFDTDAQNPKAPGLVSELKGKKAKVLPSQAVAGRSKSVKINYGQLRSGRLSIDLPGNVSLRALRGLLKEHGNKRFAWVGRPDDGSDGRVVLGISNDAVSGTIAYKGRLYKLEPRPDGSHVLSEVGLRDPEPHLDPIPVAADAGGTGTSSAATAADGDTIIDVLVAYTPGVQSRYGTSGAEALIIQAVAEANQAYANSGITARLNLLDSVLTNYSEAGDMSTDLSRLRSPSDGYMDELHTLRDARGADLVSVIADSGNACGIGYLMTTASTSFAPYGFSVVKHNCATGYYSFAHELGHNQGAHHDPANAGGAIYPYAYGHQDPFEAFRTVMAYNCPGGCVRVDHFSNPNVNYNGSSTGVDSLSNNARAINNTAPTVAAFRETQQSPTPPAAPSDMTAAALSDSEIQLDWTDRSADESGFNLERSTDGSSFSQIAALTANTTSYVDSGLDADTLYYYRVRAWNSAGNSGYSGTATAATEPTEVIETFPPSAPTSLRASAAGTDSISLEWADTSDDEEGFNLQRRVDGSSQWTTVVSLAANTTRYTDSGLQADTLYHYRVNAFNAVGSSSNSNSDSATTEAPPTITPPSMTISSPADGALFTQGQSIALEGVASSEQDGGLNSAIVWESSLDGTLGGGTPLVTSGLSVGDHTITASVTDSQGKTTTASITLRVVPAVGATELIIDNLDAATSQTGTWKTSSGTSPWDGQSVYNDRGNRFRWSLNIPADGNYDVYAWWTYHRNRSSSVPYYINHATGTGVAVVDQRDRSLGGQWVLLGSYRFTAGSGQYVEVSSENGQASADAVRLVTSDQSTNPPSVSIESPADRSSFSDADSITFSGSAVDAEDDTISCGIEWTSSLDGALGTGASVTVSGLSAGEHTISARITDSSGESAAQSIIVVVNAVVATEILVDNKDAGASWTGTWKVSSGINPWDGQSVYNDRGSRFRWSLDIPADGNYDVYAWWTYHKNRSSSVPYYIHHDAGGDVVVVDQGDSSLGGKWVPLGSYPFTVGSGQYLEVSSENGQASADAVRLIRR